MPIQWVARKREGKFKFLSSHWFIFLLCSLLMIFGKADITVMHSARTILTGLTAPIANVISVPFRAAGAMLDGVSGVANLREENLQLRRDNQELSEWRRRAEILQSENRQLRAINGVLPPPDTRPVSARVIAVNGGSFAHSVMVNAGAGTGIRKGHAVTTNEGLVGIVVDVGIKHAQILLITDINVMVPVILSASSWQAATVGVNGRTMRLRFLPSAAEPSVGELVQTSGHGGVLPAGIPVGRITAINRAGDSITVTPEADLQRLAFVTILVGDEDPGYAVDDIFEQRIAPLAADDLPPEATDESADDSATDTGTAGASR